MVITTILCMPFAIIFFLLVFAYCHQIAKKVFHQWRNLVDFGFLKLEPPNNQEHTCSLYGLHGQLTELGNELIRKITGNCLSFYASKKEDEIVCFVVSSDGSNLPYRHLLMKLIRQNGSYPIAIYTNTGKIYEKINTDFSLKLAVKEIIQSNDTRSLIDAMMFVFWGHYQMAREFLSRDALVSTHGEDFVNKYEQLSNLKKQGKLTSDKEREDLIKMQQATSPHFAIEIGECENSDIEKLYT